MNKINIKPLVFSVLILLVSGFSCRAAELFIFESGGCEWCESWEEDIGKTFHLTDIGQRLPLRRLDIDDPIPAPFKHFKAIVFSPTFVLVEDGVEIGRIVGYIGEYQFWTLLEQLIQKVPTPKEKRGKASF